MLDILRFTGGIAMTNGYYEEIPGGGVAVDAPEGFADWLQQHNKPVSALLLTHQHFDHVIDAARIQREFNARVYAFEAFSRRLTLEEMMEMATGVPMRIEPFEADELLEGKSEIEIGGLNWRLAHVPGHSPDSITFYHADENLLFSGDALFMGSVGRTDFPGGDGELLIRGILQKLLVLPDETTVLPGHGEATTIGIERVENPYLQAVSFYEPR